VVYGDSSALVKLVIREPESEALEAFLAAQDAVCSSIVAAVEVPLAARKGLGDAGAEQAGEVLSGVSLLDLDLGIARRAAEMTSLRSLDAIHLSSALSVAEDLEGLVTYDRRLAEAAAGAGLVVLSPA